MSNEITAVIKDEMALVSYVSDGRKRTTNVPAEALCKALMAGSNIGRKLVFTPPGMRVNGVSGNNVIVGYVMPERVGAMPFRIDSKNVEYNSVWPCGVTFITFNSTPQGLVISMFYQFGLKSPVLNGDTMMYQWPGSNVYPDNHCCIGNISVPAIGSIEQTGGLPFIFYNGISNSDLSDGRFKPFEDGGNTISRPKDLYKMLSVKKGEEAKPFPYDIMKNACTLNSFLNERGYK